MSRDRNVPGAVTENPFKVYVDVTAVFTSDGRLLPLWITWEDGRRYRIDRIRSIQRAASRRAGGCGIRYVCSVCGHDVELFYEENYHWFLHRKTPSVQTAD